MQASQTVEIGKPVEVVWACVSDLKVMDKWFDELESIEVINDHPFKANVTVSIGGVQSNATLAQISSRQPSLLVLNITSDMFFSQVALELTSLGTTTQMRLTVDAELDGFARIASGKLQRELTAIIPTKMQRLKAIVEAA